LETESSTVTGGTAKILENSGACGTCQSITSSSGTSLSLSPNALAKQGYGRHFINTIIFIISAIAHEYIVAIAAGRFSYLILVSFAMQYAYIIWEQHFLKATNLEKSSLGNFLFWINLIFVGLPVIAVVYYLDIVHNK